jgi:hypothetical protein
MYFDLLVNSDFTKFGIRFREIDKIKAQTYYLI